MRFRGGLGGEDILHQRWWGGGGGEAVGSEVDMPHRILLTDPISGICLPDLL